MRLVQACIDRIDRQASLVIEVQYLRAIDSRVRSSNWNILVSEALGIEAPSLELDFHFFETTIDSEVNEHKLVRAAVSSIVDLDFFFQGRQIHQDGVVLDGKL